MSKTTVTFESRFFWILDREIPEELLTGYQKAISKQPESGVAKTLQLLQKRIPILPQAYLTPQISSVDPRHLSSEFVRELEWVLHRLEEQTGQRFGESGAPLLLTVQGNFCGAVRGIGVTPKFLPSLIHQYGAAAAYRRYIDFLETFSTVVLGCPFLDFCKGFSLKGDLGALSPENFLGMVAEFQNLVSQKTKRPFPVAPEAQLLNSILHAAETLKASGKDEIFLKAHLERTQDEKSIQGVGFSRDPFSGQKNLYGVFVRGRDGKKCLLEPDESQGRSGGQTLRDIYPDIHAELKRYLPEIEKSYRNVIEADFVTDGDGRISFTSIAFAQTTSRASLLSSLDLNREGTITDIEAALRIKSEDMDAMLHPTLDESSRARLEDLGGVGMTASPGTAIGKVFFEMNAAIEHYRSTQEKGRAEKCILITEELLIGDVNGLHAICGLITRASGISSHGAVLSRANNIPCIVGYKGLELAADRSFLTVNGKRIEPGTLMTLDAGSAGRLYLGKGVVQNISFQEGIIRDVAVLAGRVLKQEKVPLEIRVNVNDFKDAEIGIGFGADAVGLCRTENMFTSKESIQDIRKAVILRGTEKSLQELEKLEEKQFGDFRKLFQTLAGREINIRLMDMPLHELVPAEEEQIEAIAKDVGWTAADVKAAFQKFHEHNPMMGLRACRLGLLMPEIYRMQTRAILRAAYLVAANKTAVRPNIMFPLVSGVSEFEALYGLVKQTEQQVCESLKVPFGERVPLKIGVMIEVPSAALQSDRLARYAEFVGYGTNDLTQATLGISRDDSAPFLSEYIEKGYFHVDPFHELAEPVCELIQTAVLRGRRVRRNQVHGICGEQGGNHATLDFCLTNGLNYVSCSPFRVLPLRLALIHRLFGPRDSVVQERAA